MASSLWQPVISVQNIQRKSYVKHPVNTVIPLLRPFCSGLFVDELTRLHYTLKTCYVNKLTYVFVCYLVDDLYLKLPRQKHKSIIEKFPLGQSSTQIVLSSDDNSASLKADRPILGLAEGQDILATLYRVQNSQMIKKMLNRGISLLKTHPG